MEMKTWVSVVIVFAAGLTLSGAEDLTPMLVVDRMIEKQDAGNKFENFGVVKLQVKQVETKLDGSVTREEYTTFRDSSFENGRVEFAPGLVVVKNGSDGWATNNGVLDTRRQTPRNSASFNNDKSFAIMLPFSLRADGVHLGTEVEEAEFAGQEALVFRVRFDRNFFSSPFVNDRWEIYAAKDTYQYLGARFGPVPEYIEVHSEGVQFTPTAFQDVDGVKLPKQVLMDGINTSGAENGHVAIIDIEAKALYEPGVELFLHPDRLKQFEDD
jgi:hypothetical protein